MAVELEQIKQIKEVTDQLPNVKVTIEQPANDNWDKAYDQIMHGDFSGLSTAILIVLAIIFLRPLIALAAYAGAFFLIFLAVKNYALG